MLTNKNKDSMKEAIKEILECSIIVDGEGCNYSDYDKIADKILALFSVSNNEVTCCQPLEIDSIE